MRRMLTIIGLAYALCALAALSPDPDHWSGAVRALLMIVAGATVLMHVESFLRGSTDHRSHHATHHRPFG